MELSKDAGIKLQPEDSSKVFPGSVIQNQNFPMSTPKVISLSGVENYCTNRCVNGSQRDTTVGKKSGKSLRRPKYAFQTKSHVDILDDGYRWRKYGQKSVKNNKFPRSYYRCTYQGCNVKKQVQRLSKDEEVVVTTYDGIHCHPLEKPTDNFEHILNQMNMFNNHS